MRRCDHCGEEIHLPFDCPYCGGSFCADHRLPPSHTCINVEGWRNRARETAGDDRPAGEEPSRPLKECFYCGVMTEKIFSCPQCGHDFCSIHRDHETNHAGAGTPGRQSWQTATATPVRPDSAGPAEPVRPEHPAPKKPLNPVIVAGFIIAAVLVIGAVIAIGIFTVPAAPPPPVSPVPTTTAVPVPTEPASQTPVTGTIITGRAFSGGLGELLLDNHNGGSDAVAVLTTGTAGKPVIAVYVSRGESYTIHNITDGIYDLSLHSGMNWNISGKRFDKNPAFVRFRDPLRYLTYTDTGQRTLFFEMRETHYKTYWVTLNGTSGEKTSPLFSPEKGDHIAPEQFPVL